jgi:hypothetical protein
LLVMEAVKRVAGSIHSLDSPLIAMLALGRTGAAIGESTSRDQALPVISDSAATVAKVRSVQSLITKCGCCVPTARVPPEEDCVVQP